MGKRPKEKESPQKQGKSTANGKSNAKRVKREEIGAKSVDNLVPASSFHDDGDRVTTKLWFENYPEEPTHSNKAKARLKNDGALQTTVDKLMEKASELMKKQEALYEDMKSKESRTDEKWFQTVIRSGTLSDKISALCIRVQEAPMLNTSHLSALVAFAKKKGRKQAEPAINALKDLFLNTLLPDRKLKYFREQALTHADVNDKLLLFWYFEDFLKKAFATYVQILEIATHDNVLHFKRLATIIINELLKAKPEQEKVLLAVLVNKLGDPEKRLASTVSYMLLQLVQEHPMMKKNVLREVEQLIYRPHVSERSQYYAIIFMNQIILTKRESETAQEMIRVYFSLFEHFIAKNVLETKMLSGLLTGVNRAYPFASVGKEIYEKQMDTLFKIVHTDNFNTSLQALMLLSQVTSENEDAENRFYRALYSKLLDPSVLRTSKVTMLLNLLFKSIKRDTNLERAKAFLKRMTQVSTQHSPPFICGVLLLVSEVMKDKPELVSAIMQPEENEMEDYVDDDGDDDLETGPSKKNVEDDESSEERFVDVDSDKEEEEDKENSSSDAKDSDDKDDGSNSDDSGEEEDENRLDIEDFDNEGESLKSQKSKAVDTKEESPKPTKPTPAKTRDTNQYDPHARDPRFAKAGASCLWELCELKRHFHPSVAKFAEQLLNGEPISYGGDPTNDFSLAAFLDRFSFRNPKKVKDSGQSIMQAYKKQKENQFPVTSEQFWGRKQEEVPADQQFFHQYFQEKAKSQRKMESKKTGEEKEEEDEESEGDAELGDMFMDSDGEAEGEGGDVDDDEDEEDDDVYNALGDDSDDGGEEEFDYEGVAMQSSDDEDGFEPGEGSVFASAEEFAEMLEDSGKSDVHHKQLKWEDSKRVGGPRKGKGGSGGGSRKSGMGKRGGTQKKQSGGAAKSKRPKKR